MYDYLIAVATLNNPKRLENFICSIKQNTAGINYTISICDDYSSQQLSHENYALAVKYKCFYTRNNERMGVPYSWNRACELADSKNIVISNDDILVVPGWLQSYDSFRFANQHLKLGVCAWPAVADPSYRSKDLKFDVNVDSTHISTPIVACSGYLFAFPRKLYWKVGGFDERYFATWEEIDFGAKLCMNGYKSVGLNAPSIYHEGGASFRDPLNQHPAMKKQSLAQEQWINKWSTILNIDTNNKQEYNLIKEISIALISKLPNYSNSDFNKVSIQSYSNYDINIRDDIEGWFDWPDLYANAVSDISSDASFVEVGSWMGKSACFMAEHIRQSGKNIKFSCVDIWDDSSTEVAYAPMINIAKTKDLSLCGLFESNLSQYEVKQYVNTIKMSSVDASKLFTDNSLDMIFIDASHEYEFVKNDLNYWWPKLKEGGKFAGHDYFWSPDGVGRAVDEFFKQHNRTFKIIGQCWFIEK